MLLLAFAGNALPSAAGQSAPGKIFNVDPAQPRDLVAQVNAFVASCPAPMPCVIRIPPGIYEVASGTIVIASPSISLLGDSASSVVINYHGANFLNFNLGSRFTIAPAGRIASFTLRCSAAGVACLRAGSVTGASFEDLTLTGPGGADSKQPCNNSTAMIFENAPGTWMERWLLRRIEMGGFCTGLHFRAPAGDTSFGYGQVDGLFTNQGPGSRGVDVDRGAQVYHLLGWTQNLNAGGTSTRDEVFHVAGILDGTGFGFNGEIGEAELTFAHLLPGAKMIFSGSYRMYGKALGAVREPGAGPFFIGPFSGDGGVIFSTSSAGSITNFAHSGKTVDVFPIEQTGGLETQRPGYTAGLGYVVAREQGYSPTSPFLVFDPGVPLCLGTIRGSYQGHSFSQAAPVFCVDGSGSIVQGNGASLAGPVSASFFRETLSTPASSSAPCTPGQFTDDASFHYVCVAPNSWKRVALSTF